MSSYAEYLTPAEWAIPMIYAGPDGLMRITLGPTERFGPAHARALAARLVELADEAEKPKPIEAPEGVTEVIDRHGKTWRLHPDRGSWWPHEYPSRPIHSFDALVRSDYGPVRPVTLGDPIGVES